MKFNTIQNQNLFLKVCPEMGASVIKFHEKKSNLDIFRPFDIKKKISKFNCYFTGYFATIPYFGAIQKKTFLNKDKYISLSKTHILEPDTIHGEGWVSKWKIKKHTKSSIELFFKHNGRKSFPHSYQTIQKFELIKNSLNITISLENLDTNSFHCGIGFHPWFNISKYSKIYSNTFTYLSQQKNNKFKKKKLLSNNFLDLNKNKIDKTFLNWNGKSKLVINKDLSLIIKNKKNIGNLHVYSPIKENFFCIEPITNISDAFLVKKSGYHSHDLISLSPKKKFQAKIAFEVLV